MPRRGSRTKLVVQRTLAPEPIAPSELETVERILARFVALAYVGDNPDLFAAGTEPIEHSAVPISPLLRYHRCH
jgi:hypothetical protein